MKKSIKERELSPYEILVLENLAISDNARNMLSSYWQRTPKGRFADKAERKKLGIYYCVICIAICVLLLLGVRELNVFLANFENIGFASVLSLTLLQCIHIGAKLTSVEESKKQSNALQSDRVIRFSEGLSFEFWISVCVGCVTVYCGHILLGIIFLFLFGLGALISHHDRGVTGQALRDISKNSTDEKVIEHLKEGA